MFFEKCLRYPKLIDNLNLNIKNKNTSIGDRTKDSFSSILYPALHHISVIARTIDVKKMVKVLQMVKNKANYGDTINPTRYLLSQLCFLCVHRLSEIFCSISLNSSACTASAASFNRKVHGSDKHRMKASCF